MTNILASPIENRPNHREFAPKSCTKSPAFSSTPYRTHPRRSDPPEAPKSDFRKNRTLRSKCDCPGGHPGCAPYYIRPQISGMPWRRASTISATPAQLVFLESCIRLLPWSRHGRAWRRLDDAVVPTRRRPVVDGTSSRIARSHLTGTPLGAGFSDLLVKFRRHTEFSSVIFRQLTNGFHCEPDAETYIAVRFVVSTAETHCARVLSRHSQDGQRKGRLPGLMEDTLRRHSAQSIRWSTERNLLRRHPIPAGRQVT